MMTRRRLVYAALGAALVLAAISAAVHSIQSDSLAFLERGRSLAASLRSFSEALKGGDPTAIQGFFGSAYQGRRLGLNRLEAAGAKDGIRLYRFSSQDARQSLASALGEWRDYLRGFERIDELQMHIHRVEDRGEDGAWTISVRFELIGGLQGEPYPAVDRALFRFRYAPGDPPVIVGAETIEGLRAAGGPPHFREVGAQAGIDFENRFYPAFLEEDLKFAMLRYGPAGISVADYDNDGFQDLFIPDGVRSRLFRNRGDGGFEDVTEASGLDGLDGVGVGLFFDFDNNGHKDLFVSRTFQPNQLFRNNGDGTFSDATSASGIGEDCCTTVASAADYDNDGDLDLYVGRYLDPRRSIPTTLYARNGEPNRLYRNNGDGTFADVTSEAGVGETGLCLGSVFGDYDNDGDPDLYVVNDFGRNTLYRNEGDGTFSDVTVEAGALAYGAGMNASMADYDNDADLDIYVTNIRSDVAWMSEAPTVHRYVINSFTQGLWLSDLPLYWEIFRQSGWDFVDVFQQMASGNNLLRNEGNGTFKDVSWQAKANPPGWFWGASFADFDNDGWLDLYAANGWVYNKPGTDLELDFFSDVIGQPKRYKTGEFFDPAYFGNRSWHGYERNRHLRNNGDGTFAELGVAAGTGLLLNSRGVAVADFWNRGVLDIAVAASTDRHALLRNEVGEKRNWLAVELAGTRSNRDAAGARAVLENEGRTQMREVTLGDGYGSQNTLRLHFGLGRADSAELLTVIWPTSGIVQRFEDIPANRVIRVREGESVLAVLNERE